MTRDGREKYPLPLPWRHGTACHGHAGTAKRKQDRQLARRSLGRCSATVRCVLNFPQNRSSPLNCERKKKGPFEYRTRDLHDLHQYKEFGTFLYTIHAKRAKDIRVSGDCPVAQMLPSVPTGLRSNDRLPGARHAHGRQGAQQGTIILVP